MIAGIGVDTATVERIEKSIARESFYTRVYGPEERAALDALSPARRAQSAAGAWAAKEALGKALGTFGFSVRKKPLKKGRKPAKKKKNRKNP